ncbi:MAG: hypothetical protein ACRD50_15525 [Candidatus Acidiferrales bacterium]
MIINFDEKQMKMSDATLNSAIEIHDSVLASLEVEGRQVKIALRPAYIHKSSGVPGVDPGTGWVQDVILSIEAGSIDGVISEFPRDLSDGTLEINGRIERNVVPLPLNQGGNIVLKLETSGAEKIMISGAQISAQLIGKAEYIEEFE